MSEWRRGVGLVLAITLVAGLVAWFGLKPPDAASLPGSSRSVQADGLRALATWVDEMGGRAERLDRVAFGPGGPPHVLVVAQPMVPIDPESRRLFEEVARSGGRVVLVGDSLALQEYGASLGVRWRFTPTTTSATRAEGRQTFPFTARFRLEAADATPLLLRSGGEGVLALERPLYAGRVVAVSSLGGVSNLGLRNPEAARFALHSILGGDVQGKRVAFDESHYGLAAVVQDEAELTDLLVSSPIGQALLLSLALGFVYLVLTGRRLGPAVRPVEAGTRSRAMGEHVQALASLYRRAGQLEAARRHFGQHYRRTLGRTLGVDLTRPGDASDVLAALLRHGAAEAQAARVSAAIEAIDRSSTERDLLRAIEAVERLVAELPRTGHATLQAA